MRRHRRMTFGLIAAIVVAAPAVAGAVGGFNGPLFGIATAPNGDLVVADASAGVFTTHNGEIGSPIGPPGATDVGPIGLGSMWVLTGAGEDPGADTGQGLYRVSNGTAHKVANLYDHEVAVNPDGEPEPDSNPFDVHSLGGSRALVADAGANALLEVSRSGDVDVVAVFPDETVSTANLQSLLGCPTPIIPDLAFICAVPAMPAQSVPTSITVGPDGYYYVGELKGFPGPSGESSIWRVSPDASWADCGSSPDCIKVFDGGFTSIIDLTFGPDGRLYVAELDEDSWAAVEIFQSGSGGSINACDVISHTCEQIASGIPILTAITFGKDANLWATKNALIPGLAEVFQVS